MKEDLEFHFADFARCMGKYGIQIEDVYNFDETGFQIGVVSGGKVLVPDDCQAAYVSDPDNRELVTVVATIGATGRSVPPMIISKGRIIYENTSTMIWTKIFFGHVQRVASQMIS